MYTYIYICLGNQIKPIVPKLKQSLPGFYLDLCSSSLRRGLTNLLCVVPKLLSRVAWNRIMFTLLDSVRTCDAMRLLYPLITRQKAIRARGNI